MPTVETRYLVTTAGAGGDGSLANPYNTLQAARTDIIADYPSLVAADVQIDLICSGATDDATAVTNTWPTSDATRYLHLKVPTADHKVPWDANVYTLLTTGIGNVLLSLNTSFFRATGIQLNHNGNLNLLSNTGLNITGAGTYIFDGVKLRRGPANIGGAAIVINPVAGTFVFRNCLAFGWNRGLHAINMPSSVTVLPYNNTIIGDNGAGSIAINVTFTAGGSGKVTRPKNNLMQLHTTGIATATNATTDDPATNHHNTGTDATFVDSGNLNYRLTSGDTVARNLGTNLSAVADWPFDWDADLTTRPVGSAWDIGAHEELTLAGAGYAFIL